METAVTLKSILLIQATRTNMPQPYRTSRSTSRSTTPAHRISLPCSIAEYGCTLSVQQLTEVKSRRFVSWQERISKAAVCLSVVGDRWLWCRGIAAIRAAGRVVSGSVVVKRQNDSNDGPDVVVARIRCSLLDLLLKFQRACILFTVTTAASSGGAAPPAVLSWRCRLLLLRLLSNTSKHRTANQCSTTTTTTSSGTRQYRRGPPPPAAND